MVPAAFTFVAVALFVAGVRSLAALKRIGEPTQAERSDPYYTSITLLFSTANRGDEFRAVQRRTIWLFCASILLLFLARVLFTHSAVP